MKTHKNSIVILMADDDADDRFLAQDAFKEARLMNELRFVQNGEELLDYLKCRGAFADPHSAPRPGLILLDLNMPRMDGREALQLIKQDIGLRSIPIVVLTTSQSEMDIIRSYDFGVAGYITKPVSFDGLVEVMRVLGRYWFELVELPDD
jgi:CheY-like chemotaxis protein